MISMEDIDINDSEDHLKKVESLTEQSEISNLIFKSEIKDIIPIMQEVKDNINEQINLTDFDSMTFYINYTLEIINKIISVSDKYDKKIKLIKRKCKADLHSHLSDEYVTPLQFCTRYPIFDATKIHDLIYSNQEEIIDICVGDVLGKRVVHESSLYAFILTSDGDFL